MYVIFFLVLALILGSIFGFGVFLQVLGWAILLPVLAVLTLFIVGGVAYAIFHSR